ncbi:ABC transporter permease [Nocardia rhizosphaerihabitans]|uniref:Transport permease protein n=1 Tax=Nocardia rhizosphaerihabitans TaxID=1691570 RepID=A0ABQ2KEB8_9NOCA|nr:ABC transporter permease [Nocardia rhizosphaerihabitans]GGN79713.1 transport permease protein [Nocardia rhizosphaerihabitans]
MTLTTETAAQPTQVVRAPRVTRVSALAALQHSLMMAWRGLLTFRHSPQLLYDAILLPIVGPVLFGSIFGTAIAGSMEAYLPIMIPGVLVQIVLTSSVATGVQLSEDIHSGVFDRFVAMPIARSAPVAGALLAGMVRYLIAAITVVIVGFCMGYRPEHTAGFLAGAVLVVFATTAISWLFAFIGATVARPAAVQGMCMLVLTFLGFASNALVPEESMPTWMQHVSNVNPVSYLVSAVRELAAHGTVGADACWSLVASVVVVAVFAPLTVRTLRSR